MLSLKRFAHIAPSITTTLIMAIASTAGTDIPINRKSAQLLNQHTLSPKTLTLLLALQAQPNLWMSLSAYLPLQGQTTYQNRITVQCICPMASNALDAQKWADFFNSYSLLYNILMLRKCDGVQRYHSVVNIL